MCKEIITLNESLRTFKFIFIIVSTEEKREANSYEKFGIM